MRFFDWFTRAATSPVMATGGGWYPVVREPFAGAWQRNKEWKVDVVLRHPTVYACVNLIASDIAKMRTKLVERAGPDARGKAAPDMWTEVESPAFSPVLRRPNRYQNQAQFKKWWIISKLVHGNAYVLLERDGRGVVVAMYLLDPNRVRVMVTPDGDVIYELREDNLAGLNGSEPIGVPASEIIHDRIPLFHPLVGVSPLFAAGGPANVGLTVQDNSSAYFDNDNSPPGILTAPGMLTEEQADKAVRRWHARRKGEIAALGNGLSYEPLRGSVVESQTIEHLKWTAESVAAAFRVPAFMVGAGPVPALNNTEVLTRMYYTTCLHDHVHDMESALDEGLRLEDNIEGRRLGIELHTAALLQMDTATQFKTLAEGIKGGFMAPNEARAMVDLEPLPGGDTVYLQQQQYSIEALAERDSDKPFAKPAEPTPAVAPEESDDERVAMAIAAETEMLLIEAA